MCIRDSFKDSVGELCADCQRRYEQNPLRLLDCKVDNEHPSMQNVPSLQQYLTPESKTYFDQVLAALDALEIPYEIDDKLVRGLDYYTHTVFEVVSTHPESGSQATVFAGGRYDGLVEYFGGPEMSGVGFAMGLERLMILAEAEQVELGEEASLDVYVMALGNVGTLPLALATECRAAGYHTEFNIQPRSLKAQFKSVDRRKARVAVIAGESEAANHQINVKFIEQQRQITIDQDELIATLDAYFQAEGEEEA